MGPFPFRPSSGSLKSQVELANPPVSCLPTHPVFKSATARGRERKRGLGGGEKSGGLKAKSDKVKVDEWGFDGL